MNSAAASHPCLASFGTSVTDSMHDRLARHVGRTARRCRSAILAIFITTSMPETTLPNTA